MQQLDKAQLVSTRAGFAPFAWIFGVLFTTAWVSASTQWSERWDGY